VKVVVVVVVVMHIASIMIPGAALHNADWVPREKACSRCQGTEGGSQVFGSEAPHNCCTLPSRSSTPLPPASRWARAAAADASSKAAPTSRPVANAQDPRRQGPRSWGCVATRRSCCCPVAVTWPSGTSDSSLVKVRELCLEVAQEATGL
jgi:hypothetical protein